MALGKDGLPVPDAVMCAKFLRAHAAYLNTGKTEWPYVNSARAIGNINDAAADILDGSGAVALAARVSKLETALLGIIGNWDEFGPNNGLDEIIDRARAALR